MQKYKFIVGLILFCFLWACQSVNKEAKTAQAMLEKAQSQAKRGYYVEALDVILKLKYQFPYSTEAQKADLLKADIFFDQMEWESASKAYQNFIHLHPSHSSVEYAGYKQILSWNRQIPRIPDRDLSLSSKALSLITDFLKKYTKGKYTKEIQGIKNEIHDKITKKEIQIAQFYFKKKKYSKETLNRLDTVISKYPKSKWQKEALDLALKFAEKLGDSSKVKHYSKQIKKQS